MSRADKTKSGSFLDTWFGRKGGKGMGAQLPRPHSESDFNEVEEQESFIEHLNDEQINIEFEKMLDDMNLSEEKKQPLREQPMYNKKKMLKMHYKGTTPENRNKFDKPADYIQYLSTPDLSFNKTHACLESLRIALTNNPLSWVQEFGTKGLKQLLGMLNERIRGDKHDRIQYECIRCLKAIMNNTVGLKQMFDQKEAFTILARHLDPSRPNVMLEAVKLLAAVCLIPPDGHERALEAITMNGEFKGQERFLPIVRACETKHNDQLKIACLQLINAIVSTPDDLDFRIHLRNEVMRVGLIDSLDALEEDANEDLSVQIKVFTDHKEDDYGEFIQRFDNVRLDFDDITECFEVLKNMVLDTSAEPYLLSILQHLLFIRDDCAVRPAYYKLIEECVSQVVLHKSGCDPDFRATKRFQIDVEPLIESLIEKSRADEDRKAEDLTKKMEEALALRQEAEARLAHAEQRIHELEDQVIKCGGKITSPLHGSSMMPPPPPMPGGSAPPPPPMPGMGGMPPPPAPPPFPGSGICPPPPPFPGGGGPPPPPPPPGMPGAPPPPPFPGGPRPPAPPGFPGMPPPPQPDVLPYGLKPKQKWNVDAPLKRANWKMIIPQKLSEKSFWVGVNEEKLASPDILGGLTLKFSSKPAVKKIDDSVDRGSSKKVKDLKVLDSKAAQNISILLGGSLKHMTYEDVKKCIFRCDDSLLLDNVLQQLILYLPPPDQLKKLEQYKNQYNELTEAEQFAVTLTEVKRLLPRLKSMSFKIHYHEMVQDIKPDIVAGTAACEEIKKSKKFAKILELILLVGNYMNSGSRNGQAFGFEISFLPKLSSTKDVENKTTLLHYLAEVVEKKFPELLTFFEELIHVDKAARVSVEMIQKTLRQMDSNIRNLETDLNNAKVPLNEDDKFAEVMGSFAKEARQQCDVLQSMFKKLETLYSDLAEYYAFDKQKYTLEEFFGDIKSFKDSFVKAYKDNVKLRETEEKVRRAKEAREKAEVERAERMARKRALVDMNAGGDQEGVMDSLMEALQTGSAFTREQRRKRAPRVAGAERRAQLNRSRSRSGLVGSSLSNRELRSELMAA